MFRRACVLVCALFALTGAQAALVTANFSQVAGSTWAVDIGIANSGTLPEIQAFTVYFSEALYADLVLTDSPAEWDSIVVEPDQAIPAAGFFDSFVLDPLMALRPGDEQGGFRVEFTLIGAAAPDHLPFDIYDENFQVLESGMTVASVNGVPEPASILLATLALAALAGTSSRRGSTAADSRHCVCGA